MIYVGDRVKVVSYDYATHNSIGFVIDQTYLNDKLYYLVKFTNGKEEYYLQNKLLVCENICGLEFCDYHGDGCLYNNDVEQIRVFFSKDDNCWYCEFCAVLFLNRGNSKEEVVKSALEEAFEYHNKKAQQYKNCLEVVNEKSL